MKRKATVNNPYHRHHSAPGGRNKVQEKVGVSDTVRVNRFAKGTQLPLMETSESDQGELEIDFTVLFLPVCAVLVLAKVLHLIP